MILSLLFTVFAAGVTADTIYVGMESEAYSFPVNEENLGFRLAFGEANRNGGVHGRSIAVRAYSRGDGNRVAQSIANAKRLVDTDGVFMLVNFGGPAAIDIGRYAMENDVPYLFPHTALLTVDGDRHVFTSFPRYDGESMTILKYLAEERGAGRIAVVHAPNPYGEYFRDRVRSLADDLGYVFAGSEVLPLEPGSAMTEMTRLRSTDPDTLVMALYPAGARKVVEAKAAMGWDVRLVSSGPLTDEQFLDVEGGHAAGTIGLCHHPDPNRSGAPGIVAYRRVMADRHPGHPLNRYSLYGYVYGRLILEGLERAGPDLTEGVFLDAMESIRDWDSGGILPPVSFSADDHHAQRAGFICELKGGHFEPLTGWIEPGG